eukprot:11660559-Alexandrium_andersonii.AAC.1
MCIRDRRQEVRCSVRAAGAAINLGRGTLSVAAAVWRQGGRAAGAGQAAGGAASPGKVSRAAEAEAAVGRRQEA